MQIIFSSHTLSIWRKLTYKMFFSGYTIILTWRNVKTISQFYSHCSFVDFNYIWSPWSEGCTQDHSVYVARSLSRSEAYILRCIHFRSAWIRLTVNSFWRTYLIRCFFREICKASGTGHVYGIHVSALGILRHAGNMLNEPCSFTCGTTCVKNLNN